MKLYLVDDQIMVRAALRSLLNAEEQFEVVGQSGEARRAVEEIKSLRPDVVLLDITMSGLSGLDAIGLIRKARPQARIIMLTHHEGESFVEKALRAGADGYLSKGSDPAELAIAIRAVAEGSTYLSPRVSRGVVEQARGGKPAQDAEGGGHATLVDTLTPREREVFQLLALGRANKEIASELGMKLGTVKKHRENLQRKLDCHSPAELSRLAIREGLLEP